MSDPSTASAWDVVTVFTAGHCAVSDVSTEAEAIALAEVIAGRGFRDTERRSIVPVSQIGMVFWREKKETT